MLRAGGGGRREREKGVREGGRKRKERGTEQGREEREREHE